ncbi:3'-5' exonuclease [Streptomyces sp. NPDC001910]|uniref:3'-5' exonuclease n=1 Tax=Streptomyces sp. NPDC001910 TaxID=3154403 RepID=UPI0033324A43
MTDTRTADPCSVDGSLPVFRRKDLPEQLHHLRTTTELQAQRLKPAAGQLPVALLRVYRSGHGWGEFPLYDPAQSAPMRPLSQKQQAAMRARRTCPMCNTVRRHVVHRMCHECATAEHQGRLDLQARTCWPCGRVSLAPHPQERKGSCEACWLHRTIQRQFEAERLAVRSRTCPGRDCQNMTATDEEIAAARAAHTWRGPRFCPPCAERAEQEHSAHLRADQIAREQAEQARRDEIVELTAWSGTVLADPDAVVLDCETTGLDPEARIVDLAVLTVAGDVLVDTLLNPGAPIPDASTRVHGITDEQVHDAPAFADQLPHLAAALAGRRVLIYNRGFDVGRLRHELTLHYRKAEHDDPTAAATAWLDAVRFEDVMIPYSTWCGDWSDYWGGYAWQPLPGGEHRALGDCRATVTVLRMMATDDDDRDATAS